MSEPERVSPLQRTGGEAVVLRLAAVALEERQFIQKLLIRGRANDRTFVVAFQRTLGVEPPGPGMTTGIGSATILWSGPTEWLLVDQAAILGSWTERLTNGGLLIVDVSSATTVLRLSGAGLHRTLHKLSALPLERIRMGAVARTRVGRLAVLVHAIAPDCLDIYVSRGFARSFFEQLRDAAETS